MPDGPSAAVRWLRFCWSLVGAQKKHWCFNSQRSPVTGTILPKARRAMNAAVQPNKPKGGGARMESSRTNPVQGFSTFFTSMTSTSVKSFLILIFTSFYALSAVTAEETSTLNLVKIFVIIPAYCIWIYWNMLRYLGQHKILNCNDRKGKLKRFTTQRLLYLNSISGKVIIERSFVDPWVSARSQFWYPWSRW